MNEGILVLLCLGLAISFVVYWVLFFIDEYHDDITDRKEFLLSFIPYYWWFVAFKDRWDELGE